MNKLCVRASCVCVSKLCVSELGGGGGRRRRRQQMGKTRTPHKDVGKNEPKSNEMNERTIELMKEGRNA